MLERVPLPSTGARHLARALASCKNIREFTWSRALDHCVRETREVLEGLSTCSGSMLASLTLSGCPIDESDERQLPSRSGTIVCNLLQNCKRLRRLVIEGGRECTMAASTAVQLAQALPLCPTLERLELQGNGRVGHDAACAILLACKAHPSIQHLNLSRTGMNSVSSGPVCELVAGCPTLRVLRLEGNKLNLHESIGAAL